MGVPILYAGSKYYPGIPPNKQYPAFSSAEVGTVNASTVAVIFSVNISASSYAAGVTIKVNGSAATISSATRQANHAIVYYVLSAAVVNGDIVTWEYSGGSIVNEATGAVLQTTSAQSVTNNVVPSDPIGDGLRADAVYYFKFDEISGTRADATGHGHSASEAGGTIGSTAGKIGNAALNTTQDVYFSLVNSSQLKAAGAQSFAFCYWVKIPSAESAGDTRIILQEGGENGDWPYSIDKKRDNTIDLMIAGSDTSYPLVASEVMSSGWHFICHQFEYGIGITVQVDGGTKYLDEFTLPNVAEGPSATMTLFRESNEIESIALDEFLFLLRTVTDDEYAYLYNSGAGRTLYP